ncbi:DNA-binding response regulator, OmpR family, contains REC and winged-helix (wHTH) domain [Anaerocolumna jejuensis DSM 15929]|uniref:Heme response regulator HssR n=1 Tax=Anaerocolumna jejuensis DSM 15929 TaxID=1121322 RepID=A0A1M7BVB4_9FIRM|nr:response regulator transcription factor [Anaerocolumna jejuensis]SHL58853.1 DNA-binding response regulator, OmpR family, contains REC and winged-helix (wHTH) domain [Anaerocolumna jejuensis DSM 15929]
MLNILVVEDDSKLQHLFCTVLKKNNFNPLPAGDGEIALEIMEHEHVDLVITDIMMPNLDGFALTKLLREYNPAIPVLMITAKDTFEDKKRGFLVGTDDYMVKPVDVNEMILRIHALIRRAKIVSERKILWGNTTLIYDSLAIIYDGTEVQLPQKEFYVLYKLMSYPGKTFTRQKLMEEIWGMDTDSEERTVDVHINRIRERLKDNKDIKIITVHGLGYKMVKLETQTNE